MNAFFRFFHKVSRMIDPVGYEETERYINENAQREVVSRASTILIEELGRMINDGEVDVFVAAGWVT